MRKEALIAVIGGLGIGVIVAFGIWSTNKPREIPSLETPPQSAQTLSEQNSNSTIQESNVSIFSPQDQTVITESPVQISGISKPNSIVVISAESDDYIIEIPENGSFQESVELVPGLNQIKIFSFEKGSKIAETELVLAYSTNF